MFVGGFSWWIHTFPHAPAVVVVVFPADPSAPGHFHNHCGEHGHSAASRFSFGAFPVVMDDHDLVVKQLWWRLVWGSKWSSPTDGSVGWPNISASFHELSCESQVYHWNTKFSWCNTHDPPGTDAKDLPLGNLLESEHSQQWSAHFHFPT